ncbi:VWA domain-containing protein [Pseudomonas syringae]|nr:VWA domain-containing protein [Pseudomonas syringae]MBD8576926.1 VWA domain-containing protein [Pseudomonas syringae]
MTSLWPYWLRPAWLLAVPLLLWLLYKLWHRQKRAGRWQMILPPAFHHVLLGGGDGRDSKTHWIVLGIAWLLAVLALVGPSWQRLEQFGQKPIDPLVVVLELTPQMLASDTPPNRLELAKRKLRDLLATRNDAQTAIVVYAGSAHTLVPLSDDLATSHNLLETIKPSIMPLAGQRADLAIGKAMALLHQADVGQGRILLIGTSLSEQERQGIHGALAGQGTPLLILGMGSRDGAPVSLDNGGLLRDDNGAIVLSRLDSASLDDLATSLGGHYQQARADLLDLQGLGLLDSPQRVLDDGRRLRLDTWADQGHWLLLPLLLLAACAMRRGWLFGLAFLCVLPRESLAFDWQDLWLRPDQQGMRLLEQQRPAEAAQRFDNRQWQGMALFAAGDYAGAAQRFGTGDSAVDHYNRGTALALNGELDGALDAFDQALERQPDFPAAQINRLLVQQARDQAQPADEPPADEPAQDQEPPPHADAAAQDAQDAQAADGQSEAQPAEQADTPSTPTDSQSRRESEAVTGQPISDDADNTTRPPLQTGDTPIDGERRQALEHWLRQIPDDPGELLRRKFRYEQQHQETTP